MKIIVKTKNLTPTSELQALIEKRISVLKKFINILKQDTAAGEKTLAEVFIELQKETKHHKKGPFIRARGQVRLPGKKLVADFRSDSLAKAVTGLKEELKKEIEKYKVKRYEKVRRERRQAKRKIKI